MTITLATSTLKTKCAPKAASVLPFALMETPPRAETPMSAYLQRYEQQQEERRRQRSQRQSLYSDADNDSSGFLADLRQELDEEDVLNRHGGSRGEPQIVNSPPWMSLDARAGDGADDLEFSSLPGLQGNPFGAEAQPADIFGVNHQPQGGQDEFIDAATFLAKNELGGDDSFALDAAPAAFDWQSENGSGRPSDFFEKRSRDLDHVEFSLPEHETAQQEADDSIGELNQATHERVEGKLAQHESDIGNLEHASSVRLSESQGTVASSSYDLHFDSRRLIYTPNSLKHLQEKQHRKKEAGALNRSGSLGSIPDYHGEACKISENAETSRTALDEAVAADDSGEDTVDTLRRGPPAIRSALDEIDALIAQRRRRNAPARQGQLNRMTPRDFQDMIQEYDLAQDCGLPLSRTTDSWGEDVSDDVSRPVREVGGEPRVDHLMNGPSVATSFVAAQPLERRELQTIREQISSHEGNQIVQDMASLTLDPEGTMPGRDGAGTTKSDGARTVVSRMRTERSGLPLAPVNAFDNGAFDSKFDAKDKAVNDSAFRRRKSPTGSKPTTPTSKLPLSGRSTLLSKTPDSSVGAGSDSNAIYSREHELEDNQRAPSLTGQHATERTLKQRDSLPDVNTNKNIPTLSTNRHLKMDDFDEVSSKAEKMVKVIQRNNTRVVIDPVRMSRRCRRLLCNVGDVMTEQIIFSNGAESIGRLCVSLLPLSTGCQQFTVSPAVLELAPKTSGAFYVTFKARRAGVVAGIFQFRGVGVELLHRPYEVLLEASVKGSLELESADVGGDMTAIKKQSYNSSRHVEELKTSVSVRDVEINPTFVQFDQNKNASIGNVPQPAQVRVVNNTATALPFKIKCAHENLKVHPSSGMVPPAAAVFVTLQPISQPVIPSKADEDDPAASSQPEQWCGSLSIQVGKQHSREVSVVVGRSILAQLPPFDEIARSKHQLSSQTDSFYYTKRRNRRGLYFHARAVECGSCMVGESHDVPVYICNGSSNPVTVFLQELQEPFSCSYSTTTIQPRKFIEVPITFSPKVVGKVATSLFAYSVDEKAVVTLVARGV